MTQKKNLKQLVRSRMAKTGERYATARRAILVDAPAIELHYPGNSPGATALRVLLSRAGVRDPISKRPFSEAMTYGLAGGVGIGVFSFYYEKADFASFFLASRHVWHDHLAYSEKACKRLGIKPAMRESSSPKTAEKNLREMLDEYGACIAWVNKLRLPHYGFSSGEGYDYHIITVYRVNAAGVATIGDLTDEPFEVPLATLTAARGQIRKDKYRLLAIPPSKGPNDCKSLVADALKACHSGLNGDGAPKNARKNFSLESLSLLAQRLISTKDPERWERIFTPGKRLWTGLLWIHRCIDFYANGGGLGRPLMADFLNEAAKGLKQPALATLAQRYSKLGSAWSELADAALPDTVAEFAEARQLIGRYSELYHSGSDPPEKKSIWDRLAALEKQVAGRFPLTESDCLKLRTQLSQRVQAIYEDERAAQAALIDLR